jgi:Trypsin-like peptidase domain
MQERVALVSESILRINALVPSGRDREEFLHALLDDALEADGDGGPIPMGIVPGLSRHSVLVSAKRTVELIENVPAISARPEGIVDLGVIEWLLRPSLLLQDGNFTSLKSGPWKNLTPTVGREIARAVCRIDVCIDSGLRMHLGSGFYIGHKEDMLAIITNAHVTEAARQRFDWPMNREVELCASFECEDGRVDRRYMLLCRDERSHGQYDLAIVYVVDCGDGYDHGPIKLSKSAPADYTASPLGVIGHPSFDSNRDPIPRIFGFGESFGVKRFSPGYLRTLEMRQWRSSLVNVALHDASTLSGSSGSCVFDLATGKAIGLHFGGWPKRAELKGKSAEQAPASIFEANGAVPVWLLANDPVFDSIDAAWV